jgi:hypothetical protein
MKTIEKQIKGRRSLVRNVTPWIWVSLSVLLSGCFEPIEVGSKYDGEECAVMFSHGIQLHNPDGVVNLGGDANITGSPDNALVAALVSEAQGGSAQKNCDGVKCRAIQQSIEPWQPELKFKSGSVKDLRVTSGTEQTLNVDAYRTIEVPERAKVALSPSASSTHIHELRIGHNAEVTLASGDYWIQRLSMSSASHIRIAKGARVRLFVEDSLNVPAYATVNAPDGEAGDSASRMLVYAQKDISLGAHSRLSALVYANSAFYQDASSALYGSVSAANADLGAGTRLHYQTAIPETADRNGVCWAMRSDATDPEQDGDSGNEDADNDSDGIENDFEPASACRANFGNAAQVHSASGGINLGYNAQLLDTSSVILDSPIVRTNAGSSKPSCVSSDCTASGSAIPPLDIGPFKPSSGDQSLRLGYRDQTTLVGDSGQEFDQIRMGAESTLTFSVSNQDYRLRQLIVGYKGSLRLSPGDYWIENLMLGAESGIDVIGEGTVRLHVKNRLYVPWAARLNVDASGGDRLLIYAYDDLVFHSGSKTHALAYARGDVELQYAAKVTGAVTGATVDLLSSSSITFSPSAVAETQFGAWCSGDSDGDGIPDDVDEDRDGDGYPNDQDAFPDDPDEWADLDGDGTGDNSDADVDGDGISNEDEMALGTDPRDPTSTPTDSDGDGVPDLLDNDRDGDGHNNDVDAFPDDPSEWSDLDGDGVGDNADTDRDGDGISNDHEEQLGFDPNDPGNTPPDMDGDGIPDALDDDRDGDGAANSEDMFPDDSGEWADLDGDGVGDNSDTDRDGDGFSNAAELARNTNPDDAADYPDDVAPVLQVNNPDGQESEAATIILTGTVNDPEQPYSGLKTISVVSDAFNGAGFAVTVDDGRFEAEVPLMLGANPLTFLARDVSGNQTSTSLTIHRISPPRFASVTPQNGALITEEKVTIAGEVLTLLPLSDVRFYVSDWQVSPDPTNEEGVYTFRLEGLPLDIGVNRFALRVVTADGTDERLLLLEHRPEDADSIAAPDIELLSPTDGSLLNSDSFRLKGRVTSYGGAVEVLLNGEETQWQGTTDAGYFEGMVSFPQGAEQVTAIVTATDSLGKSRETTFTFHSDSQPPQILVDEGLSEAPAVNRVVASPVQFSGTVIDPNLASLFLNEQPLKVQPGASEGHYDFGVALGVDAGGEKPITLVARDRSGNKTTVEYLFQSDATLSLEMLSPADNAQLVSKGAPVTAQVAARLSLAPEGSTATVSVGNNPPDALSLSGTLASGPVELPQESGNYRISVSIKGQDGNLLATTSRTVSVLDAETVPVSLDKAEPASNETLVEPNAPVELYFNKAIDPARLSVEIRETLHGKTYVNSDPLGVDFLNAEGYELQSVVRDRVLVPGELMPLPGHQAYAFYPSRHYGFNATVYVDVVYDGEDLSRYQFQVRPLPTFITGGIRDQFGQPLAGIKVALPDLGLEATTNADGSFGFGAQTRPGEEIPGGRHEMRINPGFADARYGSQHLSVSIQEGNRNGLGQFQIPELSPDVPFSAVSSTQQQLILAGGDLQVDLSSAQLLFDGGNTSGDIQTQFYPHEHLGVASLPAFSPLWAYATQPRGVEVEGSVSVRMVMPQLGGSYDYIPSGTERVVMVGYDPTREVLAPVGVGRVDNHTVTTEGELALETLDYLAYVIVAPQHQPLLEDFSNGSISLNQLISELQ